MLQAPKLGPAPLCQVSFQQVMFQKVSLGLEYQERWVREEKRLDNNGMVSDTKYKSACRVNWKTVEMLGDKFNIKYCCHHGILNMKLKTDYIKYVAFSKIPCQP